MFILLFDRYRTGEWQKKKEKNILVRSQFLTSSPINIHITQKGSKTDMTTTATTTNTNKRLPHNFTLDESQLDWLKTKADEYQSSMSAIVRILINREMKNKR
jgi:hypothetical protein